MSNYIFNEEEATECVIVLAEQNRCGICDNTSGTRARYSCGHSACDDCVAAATNCLLCLSPASTVVSAPFHDSPATTRAKNASTLIATFQKAFSGDVYKKRKLSEQLKLEKSVFPECIQAPIKYYNKRKSSISHKEKEKENRGPSFFPGEQVSPLRTSKMENSYNYVRKWLDNNDNKSSPKIKRQPFADLDTNKRIPRRADKILEKVKENTKKDLKRKKTAPFKSAKTQVQNQTLLGQYLKPVENNKEFKRIKRDFKEYDEANKKKSDKDESGIVMDDEPIVIDDSQNVLVDKDKLAWLAVLEANAKDPFRSSQGLDLEHTKTLNNTERSISPSIIHRVPFYKKSYLYEPCSLCAADGQKQVNNKAITAGQTKDVSINIESDSFTTTINISSVKHTYKPYGKRSVEVQTNLNLRDNFRKEQLGDSEDLFTADVRIKPPNEQEELLKILAKVCNEPSHLVIADSDSDDAKNESSVIQVTADVHHSYEQEHGVLAELASSDIQERGKRIGRGVTPNSSDSSDKENFDPNKAKRIKDTKKNVKKRK